MLHNDISRLPAMEGYYRNSNPKIAGFTHEKSAISKALDRDLAK
jgi:hypothetical protein